MASGSSDERLTKKIAQLTKVIVLLNAKNEDFEQEKRSIVQAYEEEIQVILEDARQRVRRVEGSLTDTLAQEDHKRLLSEAEVVYIKQREEDEARFNQHCQSLNDQLQQSNERHQERDQQLHALKQQAMTLQQDVGAISTSAGFKLKDAQRKHTQEVQELRAQHDLRLQEQHDTATTSLSLLQSDLEASQRAFQQTQLELAAKESVLQECQSRSAELELAHRQASDENDNKQGIVAAELKAAQALAAEQSRTISVLEDQLQEAKTAQEDSASECSSAREMMSEQQTELVTLKAEIAQLQARLVETAELSTTDASALTCKLESLTKELGVANSTVATQGKTIQNLDVYCKKAEAALEASATELIKAKKELARLQQQTAEVDGRELNHQAERQRLLHNLDQGEANHQRSLAELQAKQADELKTLESKLLERLGMATRRYDELEKQAQVDKDRQEAKWKSQQDQWHELEQQLKGIASARQLVIEKLELRLNDSSSLATDLHQAQQEIEAASEHIRALRSALAKAQQETQVVTTNLASTTEQHRVDVLALKDTVQQEKKARETDAKAAQDQQKALRGELSKLREHQLADVEARLKASHQAELDSLLAQWEQERRTLTNERDELRALTRSSANEGDQARSQHAQALQDQSVRYERTIREMKQRQQEQLEQLQLEAMQTSEQALVALKAKHAKALAALKEAHEKEANESKENQRALCDRLAQGTASEVDKARKEAEATLRSRLGQQDAALKQRFLRDKQQTVEAIEVQHSREMARITMTHEEQLTKAESAGELLRMQVLDLDAHLKSRENDLDKAITQADALRSELAKAHQDAQDEATRTGMAKKAAEEELEQQALSLQTTYKAQLEEVIAKYREQFSKAGIEAQRIQQTLQSKLKQQSELLDRIRQEYAERPPRPQDIERIARLENELDSVLQQLRKAQAANQRLNLEVAHREQSFNVHFKTAPAVGTLTALPSNSGGRSTTRLGSGRHSSNASNSASLPQLGKSTKKAALLMK